MVNKPFWHISDFFWRHILLVVWKCLILCQLIVICGKCWFSSFIQRKRRLKRIESSKKFTAMLLEVKQCAVIGSVASKRWFRCWWLSVWRKAKTFGDADVIYYELLKPNETITGGTVSNAIDALEPSTARKTATIRAEARKSDFTAWQCSNGKLPHPLYLPDFAPSDYYLLRSVAHGLADQQFRSYEDIEKWLDSSIASK